jgi:hypothetical protein
MTRDSKLKDDGQGLLAIMPVVPTIWILTSTAAAPGAGPSVYSLRDHGTRLNRNPRKSQLQPLQYRHIAERKSSEDGELCYCLRFQEERKHLAMERRRGDSELCVPEEC